MWLWNSLAIINLNYLCFQILEVTFIDILLESQDFIYLFEGNNTGAPLIATIRGEPYLPIVYTSSQNSMFVSFKTDKYATSNRGFNATFSSVAREFLTFLTNTLFSPIN